MLGEKVESIRLIVMGSREICCMYLRELVSDSNGDEAGLLPHTMSVKEINIMKQADCTKPLFLPITEKSIRLSIAFIALTIILFLPGGVAASELLVDTGPASASTAGAPSLFASGNSGCSPQPSCAASFQFLAGQFRLSAGATLSSVEGWISVQASGSVEIKIRADNNGIPGASIYSQPYGLGFQPVGWIVFANYNAVLPPGTYWLSFEPVANSQFSAAMPGGAPSPLQNYAFFADGNNRWINFGVFGPQPSLGFRISGTSSAGTTLGSLTRVTRVGSFGDVFDSMKGDAGELQAQEFSSSGDGTQTAHAMIVENGLKVGAWSASRKGSARAIGFRTFLNATAQTKRFRVKAVLDGRFSRAWFGLPTGRLNVYAAVRVFNTEVFNTRLRTSGVSAGEFMLGGYDAVQGPGSTFQDLPGRFGTAVLGNGETSLFNGPFDEPVTARLDSGFVVVGPNEPFTVMFDIATVSEGFGSVLFNDTLSPDSEFFVDMDGNPVAGIVALGPSAVPPASVATLTLTPETASGPIGVSHTLTASATTGQGEPAPDTVVTFEVVSGPGAGLIGGGLTNAGGRAMFTYFGDGGVGVDNIQARVGTLQSNVVQKNWSGFDVCLQDDSNGNILRFNEFTGDYVFTSCSGITANGTASVFKKGGSITLQHMPADRRVTAQVDTAVKKGSAAIQLFSPARSLTIIDRNIANNSCACR